MIAVPTGDDEPIQLITSLVEVVNGLRPDDRSAQGSARARQSTQTSALGGVFGRWDEAVGASVAAHVQPVKVDGSLLVVSVDDPAWATQLKFLEGTLRERLLEVTGAVIERIEVRVTRPGGQAAERRSKNTKNTST